MSYVVSNQFAPAFESILAHSPAIAIVAAPPTVKPDDGWVFTFGSGGGPSKREGTNA